MNKNIRCSLIVQDDFNNVLLVKKKVKKGEISKWALVSQKRKGKESIEKTVHRAAKDVLKAVIFDLKPLFEYDCSQEECSHVFSGIVKEKVILDKKYDESKWINRSSFNDYIIEEEDLGILKKYFK